MSFWRSLSDWWGPAGNATGGRVPNLPDFPGIATQRVRVRERRTVSGEETLRREISVEVRDGVVVIVGDVRGLEINGRRVRFKDPL